MQRQLFVYKIIIFFLTIHIIISALYKIILELQNMFKKYWESLWLGQ